MNLRSHILRRTAGFLLAVSAIAVASYPVRSADKRIVLIAGRPSHPPGMHEFRAGCLLLQKALSSVPGVTVQVYDGGWPSKEVDGARVDDSAALDNADAVLIFSDGGRGNPAIQGERAKVLDALAGQGRRPRLRALRGRSVRPVFPAKRCSDGSAGTTKRTSRSTRCGSRSSASSQRIRLRAASGRSPLTTSGTSACGGRPTRPQRPRSLPSSSRRRATRYARVPTSARAARTTTSSPRAARPKR